MLTEDQLINQPISNTFTIADAAQLLANGHDDNDGHGTVDDEDGYKHYFYDVNSKVLMKLVNKYGVPPNEAFDLIGSVIGATRNSYE